MRKKAIGIDLGTTNSVMAVVREDVPEIIPMGTNDDQVLRSAVYFSNISGQNHVSFGKEAIERGTEIGSTENFKFDFKRDIGRPIASDTPDHTRVNSIILSALVLNEFRKRAYVVGQEMGQADGIKDAVITVPAYFTSDQRAELRMLVVSQDLMSCVLSMSLQLRLLPMPTLKMLKEMSWSST
ncbi:MAG: Hsp70 family protein [Streptococcus sp.]